jgi:hypothetical protein
MDVICPEKTPILIHNTDHKNFVETDKVVPAGTVLSGEYLNIIGKRKGKEFTYRIFKDKDGVIVYQNKVKPMEVTLNANGESDKRVITFPNVQDNLMTHAVVSAGAAVLGYAVAKRMGKANKTAFWIAAGSAFAGYVAVSMIAKQQKIKYQKV